MSYDTIIVGAGICGLCAALELSSKGQRVLILEAQDYIGGRTKSISIGDGISFNEGGHWFHGGDINPFYQWAKTRYNLGPIVEDKGVSERRIVFEDHDHTEDFPGFMAQLDQAYEKLEKLRPDDFTLADIANELDFNKARAFVMFMAQLWMAADTTEDISMRDMYEDPLGVGGWQLVRGMSHLMTQIATDIKKAGGAIETNAAVVSVENTQDGVRVETSDGKAFTAKSAIVTASIGVLQARMIGFDESTQTLLSEFLSRFTMGHFFKACFGVDEAYFLKNKIGQDFPVWVIDEEVPKFVHARTAGKPIVTVFTGGAQARAMEEWDNQKLKVFALDVLEKTPFFKGIGSYIQGEAVTTSWSSNMYTRGAYSFKKPGCAKSGPLQSGNIVIAGEAWLSRTDESPGQMAGAWRSGQQAASILLNQD